MTHDEKKQIAALRGRGVSYTDIASQLGLSRDTVKATAAATASWYRSRQHLLKLIAVSFAASIYLRPREKRKSGFAAESAV